MHVFFLAIVVLANKIHGLATFASHLTEETVVASFVQEIHRDKEECWLVLGHDYQRMPLALSASLRDHSLRYGPAVAIKWDRTIPAPPVNSGTNDNFEYWFSWLERPTARYLGNCLFVVLIYHDNNLNPLLKYVASVVRLDPRKDRVLYYSPNSDVKPAMLESEFLFHMGVLYDQTSGYIQIANKCHFCDKSDPGIVTRGTYSVLSGITPPYLTVYPDFSMDMKRKFLNITWILESTSEEIRDRLNRHLPVFPYVMFMDDAGYMFNFQWQSRRPVAVPGYADEQRLPDGNFTGVIGALQRRECLISGAYMTENSVIVADSPSCFYSSYITFGRRLPRPLFSWTAIFKPYSSGMWSLITSSAFGCSVVFFFLLKFQYAISYPFPENQQPPSSHMLYSFRYIWSGLIEENPNLIPTASAVRVLICFWWLFCDLIVCGYEAKFFSFLVTPDLEILPSDYNELVETPGWKWGGISNIATYIDMSLERSEIQYHDKVLKGMQEGLDMLSCLMKSISEDFACIGASDMIYPAAYIRMDLEGNLPIDIVDDSSLRVVGGALAIKYSVLSPGLNRFQSRTAQSGMFEKYVSDFIYAIAINNLKSIRAEKLLYKLSMELKISQIKGPLVLLCTFLIVSLIVFFGELINYRCANDNFIAKNVKDSTNVRMENH